MNNQDLLYNIALTLPEVDTVLDALGEQAKSLDRLSKKIYQQGTQQKEAFERFEAESRANNDSNITETIIEEEIAKESNKKSKNKNKETKEVSE